MLAELHYWAALPEIIILAAASAILLIDLFVPDDRRHVSYWLTQLALLLATCVTLTTLRMDPIKGYHGLIVDDMLADFLRIVCFVAVSLMLFYSRAYLVARNLFRGDVFVLMLFALLGMQVMITGANFLTLYLGLELMTLSIYAMVALQRDSVRATEAAMKYFVLGALASGLLLYGLSMLYGATGSLELTRVAYAIEHGQAHTRLSVFGLVFIVAGIAFKLGAVPFHMWIPDVYHGASTPATLFIGAAPKLAAFAFIMRLLANGLQGMTSDWQLMLVILAVASIGLGNVVAIAQTNLKRMLAYSTISHMGFLVLGILAGTDNGYSSALFYVVAYVLMTLASFGMILLLSRAGFEAEDIDDFKGLNRKSKWYAFMMLIVMFSLAGIPPAVGFFAKLAVLQAVLDAGYTWLVVYAVLMSVIGAFYYLRVVKVMYMDEPAGEITIDSRADMRWVLSANGLAILALGILPAPLMDLCARAITASM
jgi:NADH-quinone oxidoreductase subunit N